MTTSEINAFLKNLTLAELAEVRDAAARKMENSASVIRVGDRVKFDAKTRGVIEGEVIKINIKTAKVKCDRTGMRWNVSKVLLTSA